MPACRKVSMTEVDLTQIKEQVAEVRIAKKDVFEALNQAYLDRVALRLELGIPPLGICGHGRAGKDLAAAWIGSNYNLLYTGSISKIISPLVAYSTGRSVEEAFNDRHNDRMYWFEYCNEVRRQDPTLLVKFTLSANDMAVGVRGDIELEACRSSGILDASIWIDNDRVDIDPTLEYAIDDCDIAIRNCGSKVSFFKRLRSLAGMLNLPAR